MRLLLALLLIISEKILVYGIPIDNGVEGDPEITCGPSFLGVKFRTQHPFGGHVYVKGRFAEAACRIDGDQSPQNMAYIAVPFDKHPCSRFLTKVDRAYYVQCFYMEADKTVTAALDVSMLTTTSLLAQASMPACRYQVLDNKDGQPIRYAKVGDPVHHRWSCDATTPNVYCMVVHACTVDDGGGNIVTLIDSNGSRSVMSDSEEVFQVWNVPLFRSGYARAKCAEDQYLLGNLEYYDDLTVGRDAHVFKYADKATISFNCRISVAPRQQGLCPRPSCSLPGSTPPLVTAGGGEYPSTRPLEVTSGYYSSTFTSGYTTPSTLLPAPPAWIDRKSRFQRSVFRESDHKNRSTADITYAPYGDDDVNGSSTIIDVDTQSILVFDLDSRLDASKLNRVLHDREQPRRCRRPPQGQQSHGLTEPYAERKQVLHSMYYRFFAVRMPRRHH